MSKRSFHFPARGKWFSVRRVADRMQPTMTVRVVEERIATFDEAGNQRILIRIRTLADVLDPMGRLVEVERDRRHTLPGFGHVYQVADDEYVVFRGRMKLRVHRDVEVVPQREESPAPLIRFDDDSDDVAAPSVSAIAPVVHASWHRERLPLYSAFVLVPLLSLAVWQRHPGEPAPSFVPLSPAIGKASVATVPDERYLAPSPASLSPEDHRLSSPGAAASVGTKGTAVQRSDARLGLAVRPWGEVYVNGKKLGISPPMKELRLPAGRYKVEIRNHTFEPHRESVDLRRSNKQNIAHEFGRKSKPAADETGKIALAFPPAARFLSEDWPR